MVRSSRSTSPPPPSSLAMQPRQPPHVFEFLTHNELRLALSLVMASKADETRSAYNLSRYATPSLEGGTDDWTELVLRAIRYLSFEHGFKFRGIVAHRDGRVGAERPICRDNERYVLLFKSGGFPDFTVI